MRILLAVAAMMVVPACSHAQGAKACQELKTEIAAKLDAKGVKNYTLDIVAKDADAADGKVVGTCEGGSKKIVYKKGEAAMKTEKKEPTQK